MHPIHKVFQAGCMYALLTIDPPFAFVPLVVVLLLELDGFVAADALELLDELLLVVLFLLLVVLFLFDVEAALLLLAAACCLSASFAAFSAASLAALSAASLAAASAAA